MDLLRGLAAVYVMVSHARWLLWEGYSTGYLLHPQNYSFLHKIFAFSLIVTSRYAHQAVIFFFVLSGFVIHLRQAKTKAIAGTYSLNLSHYLKRRFVRIYPPFIFSIVLTFFADLLGEKLYLPLYTHKTEYTINYLTVNTDFNLSLLIKNIFFLQRQLSDFWGSNQVIWSLQMEWWFYLIYPLVLMLFSKSTVKASVFVAVLCISTSFTNYPLSNILSYFLIWWMGVLLCEVYLKNFYSKPWAGILLLIFIVPVMISGNAFIQDLAMGLVVAGIISIIYHFILQGYSLKLIGTFSILSKFSYTLYIVHFPIFMVIAAWYMSVHQGRLPMSFLLLGLSIALVLTLSYIMHFILEKPFIRNNKKKLV